ncbi:FAD-dependent oxidoreductase [Aeromicrobium fastidiosum]|uniref:NAD(P)-binding protein n=1 Tax=Aeromicrobium fastidiosum TaxID=52699 RepID=A0A641ARY5_9ACTN|nr:FAD-dependent oxidoreductase [Aeromicrobium fastidiosum]KAA1380709.1 NAD(P)-binding protein [Aeromicrobium fastidiosum]MBP2390323.1 thioredoxin reductase [Aeromicrobium fastidiosum]
MTDHDLAIVGAGPAGMTAALTASRLGLSVVVIDEQQRPGGQIFRQPPANRSAGPKAVRGYPWGHRLVVAAEAADNVEWRYGTTALGVLRPAPPGEGIELVVRDDDGADRISVRSLLIASGAMDLPVAFPGWTLPGVVTAGGVQTMLKAQDLLLARDVVLTGGHPLLLVVAGLIHEKGGRVVELAMPRSQGSLREMTRALGALPGHLGILANAASTAARLVASGTPIRSGSIVTAARGDGRVEEVDVARLGPGNTLVPDQTCRTVAADGLVVGYGFQPSTDLARQAGCELRWDSPAGGWVVAHDDELRTTVPGVYVAGEPSGVAGADQSRAEGQLAALCIVHALGGTTVELDREIVRARRALRHTNRFASTVQRMFEPPRQTLAALADADTTVCRCEGVTRERAETVIDDNPFISSIGALKLECRTGMGPCQGRYCELTVAGLLAQRRDMSIDEVGAFNAQFPIRPATVGELSRMAGDRPSPVAQDG